MRITKDELPGVLLIEPDVFGDERGYFMESWSEHRYREIGIDVSFVQDNLSFSRRGTLRGLHLQHPFSQGKLVSVLAGEVYDVAVDVRVGSATFGRWCAATLSAENRKQLYIPPGYAHGFCVTSDEALFMYKCSERYRPETELTIAYDDPEIGIPWPVNDPIVSAKDQAGMRLRDVPRDRLPSVGD